jgi:hypothetical protein
MAGLDLIAFATFLLCHYVVADVDYSQFVNPFIGSEGAIPGYACEYLSFNEQ